MVKTKKGKKETIQGMDPDADNQIESDDDSDRAEVVTKTVKPKKEPGGRKKAGDAGDVDEISKNVKQLKVGKKSVSQPDDDDVDVPKKKSVKNRSAGKKSTGFDLLMADLSDDDDNTKDPEPEPEWDGDEPAAAKGKNKTEENGAKTGKKGKKSKKKRTESDDDDIDRVLAELEMEYSGEKKPEPKQIKTEPDPDPVDDEIDDDGTGTVKTVAQKKKEKRERQKRDAALSKQQKDVEPVTVKKESIKPIEIEPPTDEPIEPIEPDDKKKKGKKGKVDKPDEKDKSKKKGGPSQAMVAAMQERLQKIKDEEERLKREEEERNRQAEEMERLRVEQIRLEAERKEKKKQKELERKARLKAEGKLLTAKQKQDKARAQAMLDNLRAQGVDLPEVGEKRPARPGTRVRGKPKRDFQHSQSVDEQTDDGQPEQSDDKPEDVVTPTEIVPPVVEAVKENWDESSSDEDGDPKPTGRKSIETAPANKQSSVEEPESEDETGSDEESDESDVEAKNDAEMKREKVHQRILKRRQSAEEKRTTDNLRAAVVCVLGHVDTGKTKILDKLRRTHVQDGEAGGITQQIGATNVPIEAIKDQTKIVKGAGDMVYKLPGLLIIDTPGHESFSNLRNRGSSLCDIAILVVDIMHGLEPQTIESINLLKSRKTPFIVALNKIDRLYDWQTMNRKDVRDILKAQAPNTQLEFQQRTKEVIVQFAEQGFNAALFYENPEPRSYINMIPTSAITGEGMGNILYMIVDLCQSWLAKRLMYSDELLATVLEVKAISGLGTTIDAILINGKLREGDTMLVAGTDGPIVTQIRSLLMPQPMKELRVKNAYIEYKEVMAAQGVKIAAKDLEKAIAGLNLYVAQKPDEVEFCRDEVAKELRSALSHIKLSQEGVYVQASTLGSLEALLEFLKTSKIPYCNIRIGPVVKRDVMKASTMLEHESQYATILAFDVKVERDAQDLADSLGVKIFQADIIYHLFDKFMAYREELKQKKRDEFKSIAVFPCKLKILPQFIFNSRDPIVMGVMIEAGIVKEGTPICVPSKEFLDIGIVTSIECNHKQVDSARKGQEVCIKIDPIPGESPKMYGRHFEETDMLVSKITRQSIDACKDYFRDDLIKADWALMVELKKTFQIL